MPRSTRQLQDGGIYHVYNRGNNKHCIFQDPQDYHVYKKYLEEATQKYGAQVFHYCLMPNHIHFLIRMLLGRDLPKLMHIVQLRYVKYYQAKYDFVGHLFQGRFKSPKISDESYYLQCGRYIERNPVSAAIVEKAEDYPFSSAAFYVRGKQDDLVTRNIYYQSLGVNERYRRNAYRNFLSVDDPYRAIIDDTLSL